MSSAMECKNEVEKDCPGYKEKLAALTVTRTIENNNKNIQISNSFTNSGLFEKVIMVYALG